MSETLSGKLQQPWPMLIGSKNTKFRQELLAIYEQEQQKLQVEQAEQEKAQLELTQKLSGEIEQLQAEIEQLQELMRLQQEAHQHEFQRLHEQVLQKIAVMEEQAELYFVKNTENQVK
ncbi:MAG: hypothetical protein ACRC17_01105 [Culicoidibacterales bacterium]